MPTDTGEINKVLLEDVFRIYQDAEQQMLKKVAKRVKKGIKTEGWNEAKLKDVQELNKEISKILDGTSKLSKGYLNKGLIKAYEAGQKGASLDFEKIKPGKIPSTFMKDVIPYHLQRMILESHNMVDRASIQVLRNTMDTYREVIAETNTGVLAGYETRLQASQNALNEFAAKGITGFTDKSGRKWELASYVEMATRTGNAHAAIQGHLDRQMELGNDLVIVSSHANTCPLCAPWGGKVLSIKGNNPKYDSLENAKAAGLFHPNCKHTITAYFPFIDEPEGHEHDKGYTPEMYEATQQQRYNERMIRRYKNEEAVALTPEAEFRAHNKVLQWQSIQREHVDEFGLRRKYSREGISNRVGDPSKVKAKIQMPDIKIKEPPKKEPKIKPISKKPKFAKVDYNPLDKKETEHGINEAKWWFKRPGNEEYYKAFEGYTVNSYTKMNGYLRGSISAKHTPPEIIKDIKTMCEGYTKAPKAFERDAQLYRATGYSYLENAKVDSDLLDEIKDFVRHTKYQEIEIDGSKYVRANKLVEKLKNEIIDEIVTEDSFTSTSYKYGAFGCTKPVQLLINAPVANSEAIQLAGISSYEHEAEILFAPKMDNIIEDVWFEKAPAGVLGICLRIKLRMLGHGTQK